MFVVAVLNELVNTFLSDDEVFYIQHQWQKIQYPCNVAVSLGYLDLLKSFEKDLLYEYQQVIVAGHLHILKWLFKKQYFKKWQGWMSCDAMKNGHMHILKWARRKKISDNIRPELANLAASSGNVKVLKWDAKKAPEYYSTNPYLYILAAGYGHLQVLKWAQKKNYWDVRNEMSTCQFAASGGHLHVLKWAIKNGCKWDTTTIFNNLVRNVASLEMGCL